MGDLGYLDLIVKDRWSKDNARYLLGMSLVIQEYKTHTMDPAIIPEKYGV